MHDPTPNRFPAREITWRRVTSEEKFRWRLDPRPALLISLIFVVITSTGVVGAALWALFWGDQSQYVEHFGLASLLCSAIAGFLVFYLAQLLGAVKKGIGIPRLCNNCFKLTVEKADHCECGGTFEDASGWRPNKCLKCGYDLRLTKDRCPECGLAVNARPPLFQWHGRSNGHQSTSWYPWDEWVAE